MGDATRQTNTADPHTGIEAWVRRHQARAWRFARLCGCPRDLADDLVQEAMMAAIHKRVPNESDAQAIAWLRSAIKNLWCMHLRSEGRKTRHVHAAAAARALDTQLPDDADGPWLMALGECLRGVDGRARRLLEGHYCDGMSRDALGRELGLGANGVKAFLRRVRAALRDCVLRRLRRDGEAT